MRSDPLPKSMTDLSAKEPELFLERGGPFYRLQQRIGLIRGDDPSTGRRVLFLIALTWVPLFILSLLQGRALEPSPRESFLLDFATYARFLVVLPLLIAAEKTVGARFAAAVRQFFRTELVRPRERKAYEDVVARAARWRDSALAEAIMLAIALVGAWTLTIERRYGGDLGSWRVLATGAGSKLSLAGLWYHAIAIPIFQFLLLRWVWRLIIWTRFLYATSRLDLDLVPTHADSAAGLGFLSTAHDSLTVLAFAAGCVTSGDAAFRIAFEGAHLGMFDVPLAVQMALCLLLFVSPLVVLVPDLLAARRAGLGQYTALIDFYNRAFHEKWVSGGKPEPEAFLGTGDIQSLADLGVSYERIKKMRFFPASRQTVVRILAAAAAPALFPILLVVPLADVLKYLAKTLF
jgi:hypothetical protein